MDQQDPTIPQVTLKPICDACATGYHDESLSIHEQCACPCHGPSVPEAAKSIADDCRSIADSTKPPQNALRRTDYEGFGIDCRVQTGVDV